MIFGEETQLPDEIHAVYRLDVNEYNGMSSLQLVVEHWWPREDVKGEAKGEEEK